MSSVSATRTQKFRLTKIDQQQEKLQKEVADAIVERDAIKKEADELEKSRVELSNAVLSAREESKKFTSQIDSIDAELRLLDVEYEQADKLLNQLHVSMETSSTAASATTKANSNSTAMSSHWKRTRDRCRTLKPPSA